MRQSACVAAIVIGLSNPAWAGGPTGGTVAAGSATISNSGANSTLITQTSQKAIINWQDFSLSKSASVNFAQPNTQAVTLNRVTGPTQSIIDGTLTANGRVWIVNRNGVMFGAGSTVNVGALIATTGDITDGDFLSGHYNFSKASNNHDAAIINNGTIHAADGGSVVLAGPVVENNGLIQADLGSITLASGEAFTVDFQGDNLIRFAVATPVSQTPKNSDGTSKKALVSNSGKLAAAGGRIVLTARAAKAVADNVINSTGIVEASSVHTEGGVIVFDAGPDGTADVSGVVDASGTKGGSISITSKAVTINDAAHIDASGTNGGGKIAIGGDLHGNGPTANAQSTTVGKATLSADASDGGDGGTIVVWSDGTTRFAGTATARGGASSGDGGLVETSGQDLQIAPDAVVDTRAPKGATGTWLLDPSTINILTSGTDVVNGGSNISPSTIITALGSSNVTLQATNDIYVYNDVTYDSANALSLLAEGDLYVAANVQNAGTGAITAIAGWDGVTTDPSLLTSTGKFGNNNGSVYVTSDYDLDPGEGHDAEAEEDEIAPVAIGSKGGLTTIAGGDVQVLGYFDHSQIGYYGAGATGNIIVTATGAIVLTASTDGACTYCYAQIGHGGVSISGNQSGDIHVTAGGTIDLTAGRSVYSYAQIGNGGDSSGGDYSGDIVLNAGSNVTLTGDGDYAQIGNGGWGGSGTASGKITAQIAGNLSLAGGSASQYGYVQIGQGGQSSSGTYSGDIAVTATGNLSMVAGGQNSASHNYVQIGNGTVSNLGGNNAQSTASGAVALTISGASTLTSRASGNDAWIGNINGNGVSSGGALRFVTGTLDISGDALNDFPAMLVSGLSGGDVTLGVSAGAFTLQNPLTYSSDHALSLLANGNLGLDASIQNSGSGNINIVAGWDGTTLDSTHFGDAGVYGNNSGSVTIGGAGSAGDVAVGSANGATLIAGQNITLNAANGYAQAGYHGTSGGNITLKAKGGVTLTGTSSAHTAQIGNGSTFGNNTAGGTVTLTAATLTTSADYYGIAGNSAAITLTGTSALGSSAQPLKMTVNSLGVTTAGTNAFITSPGQGLSLAAVNVGAGSFNLSAAGAITQSGAITAATLNVASTGGAISLTNAANSFGNLVVTTSGSNDATLFDSSAVALGTSNVGGTFKLTSGGAITQTGAISAATLNIASTGGTISLTKAANSFGNLVVTTSGSNDATLLDNSAVALGTNSIGGTFTLTSGGAITQTGAISAATLNIASTGGTISLINAANSFGNLVVTTSG
ncbi:MAG TPA: filamentous hemagglutinin N-terminal domain-containing protein, partial [Rhizomicrobium sp.]|nr:filamentous hemagglutinin N-terminal domain-containing protein [Rhizomicrobium sp.]